MLGAIGSYILNTSFGLPDSTLGTGSSRRIVYGAGRILNPINPEP